MEQIDFAALLEQAEKAGTPPTAGIPHMCRCDAAKWKVTANGTAGINARWTIIAGPDEGKAFYDNFWFTGPNIGPESVNRTFNKMRVIGVDPATLPQVPQEQQPQLFIGKLSSITVSTDREYGNAKQVDVDNYAPANGAIAGSAVPPPLAAAPPLPAPVAVPAAPVAPVAVAATAPAPVTPVAPVPVAPVAPVAAAPVAPAPPAVVPQPVAPVAPLVAPVAPVAVPTAPPALVPEQVAVAPVAPVAPAAAPAAPVAAVPPPPPAPPAALFVQPGTEAPPAPPA